MIAASDCYSSTVLAELIVQDHRFSLARVGPDKVTVRTPMEVAPAPAEIILHVDGAEFHYSIYLIEGMSAESGEVRYRELNEGAKA